jgi:hypothetical protein
MKEFWDERFSAEEYAYGIHPNLFFKQQVDTLTPGTLLLPAEGEGRNAVYAASKGWEVTAVDYSKMARKKALMLANDLGTDIDYRIMPLHDFKCDAEYDAIGLVFIHFRPEERIRFHHKMIDCLKSGGVLIAELFHKKQLGNKTGGPPAIELLYTSDILKEDFGFLEIDYLKDETVTLKEGLYHTGKADVVRLVARKP